MRGLSIASTSLVVAALAALGKSPAAALVNNTLLFEGTSVDENNVIVGYNRVYDPSLTTVFGMYEVDCSSGDCICDTTAEVDSQYLTATSSPLDGGSNPDDEVDGMVYVTQTITFNKTSIYVSPIWSGDNSNGTITFCARAELESNYTLPGDDEKISVNFHEHEIRLNINLRDNVFSLNGGSGVTIERDDVQTSDQNFTNVYEVIAYQCPGDDYTYNETVSSVPVEQNEPLRMCLRPNSTDVYIFNFDINNVTHNDTEYATILGVTDSSANNALFVNILSDGTDQGIATKKLDMLIPSDMYEDPSKPVFISGNAELEFESAPARRRVQVRLGHVFSSEDAKNQDQEQERLLQEGGESAGTSAMQLEVMLEPVTGADAVDDLDVVQSSAEHGGDQGSPSLETYSVASNLVAATLKMATLVVAVSVALF